MLAGGLLLDGVGAEILCQRGFGPLIGVDFERWHEREGTPYSIEIVAAAETGVRKGFCFNANLLPRIAELKLRDGAREWTTVLLADGKRLGPNMTAFRNELGGRAIVFAAPDPAGLPRSYQRQRIIESAVRFLSAGRFGSPTVSGAPNLLPIHLEGGGKRSLVVFNGSPDPARPSVRLPGAAGKAVRATMLAPLAKPVAAKVKISRDKTGATATSTCGVPYLGFLVIEW